MATPCNCDTFSSPVTIDAATSGPQLVVQGGTTGSMRVFPGSGSALGSIEAFASGDPTLQTAWTRLRLTADGTTAWVIADAGNGGTAMPIAFQAGGAERLRLTTAGNVGIGTTSPQQALDVNGTVRTNGILLGGDMLFFGALRDSSGTAHVDTGGCYYAS